ncbi:MAG: hypothetical protein FJW35_07265, partial [Acidobacteria bacterium]|nr:hypothetical protein [Acidobacteriota bacterium]
MKSKVVARGVRGTCLVALAISAMLAATLWAQGAGPSESYFIFPRFLSYQYQSTGIAVFNPGVRDATVRLTLRRWDGALVTTVPNPVEITVPARGQTARTAGELFGDTAYFDASLELWSPTPGLVAYYQAFDSQGTFIDGADAPASSMDLVFPVIPGPSEGAAEIDLMNPNPRSTAVELKAYSFGGAVLGKATVQVPAGGAYRSYPEDIFPAGTNLSGVSHIRATSKPANMLTQAQTVMGTSLFAGFSSYAPPGSFVDVAALNALPLAQAGNSNAVPYFRIGSDFASVLSLANLESSSNDVTLTAIANDGSALAIRRITLGANAGHRGPLQSILTGLGAEQEGWLLIQAAGRVTGALIYGRTDGASLAAVPLQPSPKLDFVFPQVVQSDSFYTELALVNPTPNTCYANVYVIGADGLTAAFNQVIVAPSKRASLRIGEIVPEVGQRAGGSIYVTAGEPLFAVASIWSEDGNLLSSFIPQQLGVSFYPAPLNSFAVTGRVTVNDLPAPGFVVILSGPSGGTAATDAFGYYAFTELLPGRYSMAVDQFGFEFIPTQAHFEIKGSSYRQNFQGYTAENSIVVQPSAIPAGSSDTTLQIFGNGFDSTSTAFVGNVRLQTAFIDSNRLEAVLPAFLVQTAARMEILVVTGPDGAAPRASRPHPIVAFLDRPELDKVQTPGNIAEGSPGASITLSGSGFLQNAKVKINGRSDGIQANWIDEGTIIAAVPGSYLQQGGIYP